MYNNTNQYTSHTGQPYQSTNYPPPQYQQIYSTSYGYQNYGSNYEAAQNQPGLVHSNPPPETYNWSGNQYGSVQDKKDGVEHEVQQQKAQLMTQREDYVKKLLVLRRELDLLKDQKQELISENSRDRDMEMILKENNKLQDEIGSKMKAITNVIEMLNTIIKDGKSISDLESELSRQSRKSPESDTSKHAESVADGGDKVNYVHYDTGMHWCRTCDEFPETAKDFLVHLQSKKHTEMLKIDNVTDNNPWHKLPAEPLLPTYEDAPQKRIPIKGLQFFISAPAWYCKLCDIWIGDLHCASHHLKSQSHFQNYDTFIQQNSNWEVEWVKDREKAKIRNNVVSSGDETSKKKKKKKEKRSEHSRDKKRKKKSKKRKKDSSDSSSSSSSSDSSSDEDHDKTRSIRVAMRNVKAQGILNEDLTGKWSVLERLVEEHKKKEVLKLSPPPRSKEDKLISQWMTVSEPMERDKMLLDGLKDRMKQKHDDQKARLMEQERRKQERLRYEEEQKQRQREAEQQRFEDEMTERKRKEQEEFNRILDKQRNQVKFRTRENYRRRNSNSEDEEEKYRRESPSRGRGASRSKNSRSQSPESKENGSDKKKPQTKRLPFIGRMPLFKNKAAKNEEKQEVKEVTKEDYEPQRRTRFEPGNLPRAFIPRPDVVCFPKLSCIPPLNLPPPPTPPTVTMPLIPTVPSPPKITEEPTAPPPPTIHNEESFKNGQYENDMYPGPFAQPEFNNPEMMHAYMPLQPPPLPPDDDLAMLGICADDMAAQTF